jgi:para-aminobenzoate N-oxygenase AurF
MVPEPLERVRAAPRPRPEAVPEGPAAGDAGLLDRLNRLSLTRSFTPQVDIDWGATTADEEFEMLYPAWSLLEGTGVAGTESRDFRIRFAKYQQMNLMMFTALLERHAISALARAYDLDRSQSFAEYIGHFIKEEIYHYTMFIKAVAAIQATMPGTRILPTRGVDAAIRWLFRFAGLLPGRKLRSSFTFTIFRFAEQVTMYAAQMVQNRIARRASLVNLIWSFHAQDEARHLAFDSMILERNRLPGPLAALPRLLAAPCCVVLSLLLNANEIWIARQLGVRVRLWQLPRLVRRTRAPFKRRVFGLLAKTLRGDDPVDKERAW